MTQQHAEPTVDGFFDNVGGGGAPSAVLKDLNDKVYGEIVGQRIVDYIPFGKTDPETNKDGSIRKQLVVTLQTELRGWAGVSKIPLVDRDDASKGYKDPSEDDGKRNVYLPQWSNIQAAVAEAVRKTNGGKPAPLRDGGKLGIRVSNLKDVGKGNPLKEHVALYEGPVASDGFFGGGEAPATQPTAPAAQAAPAAQPAPAAAQAPAAQPAPAAAPQVDPWSGQAVSDEPPF